MKRQFSSSRRRRFLRGRSVESLIAGLNKSGRRYVILRWFNNLPLIAKGEDIDLLVEDEGIDDVRSLLKPASLLGKLSKQKGTRCDVYSVTGAQRTSYKGIAYYPPHLANRILDRAVASSSGAKVPCPEDHFFSLAYHALFHKGLRSGLPVANDTFVASADPEHDYRAVLTDLAKAVGFDVPIEMNALADFLQDNGWHPPHDTLERLLPDDPWIIARARSMCADDSAEEGLAVFLLRESAFDHPKGIDHIVDQISGDGFFILDQKHLAPEESRELAGKVRGANWGLVRGLCQEACPS